MQQGGARGRLWPSQRLHILVVEDDARIASLIAAVLEEAAQIHAVSTVDDATRFLAAVPPRRLDLGIVDCLLRGPDATIMPLGVELVAAMHEQLPNLPIIVVTGADDVESLMLASFRGGARDFLRKPFTVDELRDAVLRVVPAALEQQARRGTPATAVARVVAFLDAHAGQSVSLGTLAKVAGMSRSHLSRSFHAIMGTVLRRYIRDRRLEHAEQLLLRSSDLTLTDVALHAGYYDLPHFDKEFRRRFGVSPSEFRRRKGLTRSAQRSRRRRSA